MKIDWDFILSEVARRGIKNVAVSFHDNESAWKFARYLHETDYKRGLPWKIRTAGTAVSLEMKEDEEWRKQSL